MLAPAVRGGNDLDQVPVNQRLYRTCWPGRPFFRTYRCLNRQTVCAPGRRRFASESSSNPTVRLSGTMPASYAPTWMRSSRPLPPTAIRRASHTPRQWKNSKPAIGISPINPVMTRASANWAMAPIRSRLALANSPLARRLDKSCVLAPGKSTGTYLACGLASFSGLRISSSACCDSRPRRSTISPTLAPVIWASTATSVAAT